MVAVYVVVENGVPYAVAYASFDSAVAVAKEKHFGRADARGRWRTHLLRSGCP
jgi:hypothetical protein